MVCFILGAEAELIKMFPVMLEFKAAGIPYKFIATGHQDIGHSSILKLFRLKPPDFTVNPHYRISSISQMVWWVAQTTALFLIYRRRYFSPGDRIAIHCNTESALVGLIAAKLLDFQVYHLQSANRSHHLLNPFPEELFRIFIERFSDVLFYVGKDDYKNIRNLPAEKIDTIYNTGVDSLSLILRRVNSIRVHVPRKYFIFCMLRTENLLNHAFVSSVIDSVLRQADRLPCLFIMPLNSAAKFKNYHLYDRILAHPRVTVIPRQPHPEFIKMLLKSEFVVSDSDGTQLECYCLGKPILVIRTAAESYAGAGENALFLKGNLDLIPRFFAAYREYIRPRKSFRHVSSSIIFRRLAHD